MKYRAEIDGLRTIAVIPVILFHAGFSTFSGGFVGVDVFFVISGYLITTIILSEMEQGSFSLANFYERRARRILPALFLVMLVSLIFAWLWMLPDDMKDFSQSLAAVSVFYSNVVFSNQTEYWDAANELKPLLHTWSLAVEEQYYVLFPLFLMMMWRYKKRWIFGSFMVLAGISLAAAQRGLYYHPESTFYLLPTRGWELAIGAGIAFCFLYQKQAIQSLLSRKLVSEVMALFGLMLIACGIFVFDEKTPFPGLYALVPTIGTGLIIVFARSQTIVGRLLSARPMVAIGLISYSAYLWHQPILAFARYRGFAEPGQLTYMALAFLPLPLAYLSWKYVEGPFRNRNRFDRKAIFLFSVASSLVFVGVGLTGYLNGGYKQRGVYQELLIYNYQPDNRILQQLSWKALRVKSGLDSYGNVENDYDQQLWFAKEDSRRRLLLVGNSHSKDLYNVLINSDDAKNNFQIARYGVQIASLVDKSEEMFDSPNYDKADVVMLASRYREDDTLAIEKVLENIISDNKTVVLVKNIFEFPVARGRTTADELLLGGLVEKEKSGAVPAATIVSDIDSAYYAQYLSLARDPQLKESDVLIDALAISQAEVLALDRMDYVCDKKSERCFSISEKLEKYFYDYGHHTNEGAEFFGDRVDEIGWLDGLIK